MEPAATPMLGWSVTEVSDFVDSLGTNGSRQNCPEGCAIPSLFEGSRFAARGLDGKGLHALVTSHAAHEATLRGESGWFPNATSLRAQHTKELLHGLLPPERSSGRNEVAYMNHLSAAANHMSKPRENAEGSPKEAGAEKEKRAEKETAAGQEKETSSQRTEKARRRKLSLLRTA